MSVKVCYQSPVSSTDEVAKLISGRPNTNNLDQGIVNNGLGLACRFFLPVLQRPVDRRRWWPCEFCFADKACEIWRDVEVERGTAIT